jgi:hypothetical protein
VRAAAVGTLLWPGAFCLVLSFHLLLTLLLEAAALLAEWLALAWPAAVPVEAHRTLVGSCWGFVDEPGAHARVEEGEVPDGAVEIHDPGCRVVYLRVIEPGDVVVDGLATCLGDDLISDNILDVHQGIVEVA